MASMDSLGAPAQPASGGEPRAEGRVAELEQQLRQVSRALADLDARDALKTQFLSNISHDLRTPLTALITHAEVLRDGLLGEINERQMESVVAVIAAGHQLLTMVGEILAYARGSAGHIALTPTTIDLAEVAEQVRALNEPLATRKEIVLTCELESDLPPFVADREQVTHILGNLVGNAIAFTPSGGRVWIAARRQRAAGAVEVEVGDTGIGIAPEHHELVFREFAQVDSTPSRPHHGTGLGLTIARQLVELHGGRIWLESALGEGTRVKFTLPERAGA